MNISECCCEAALYKYSHPGVVPLGSGDVVWTTNYWARQYKVEFDIKVRVDSVLPLLAWAGLELSIQSGMGLVSTVQ